MKTIQEFRSDIINNNNEIYKQKILKIKNTNKNINIPDNNVNKLSSDLHKLSYAITLINFSINKNFINKKGFLKELTNEINQVTAINFSTNDVFKLIKQSIENKKMLQELDNNTLYKKQNVIDMKGGFFAEYFDWNKDTGFITKVLDIGTTLLDILGFIPGAGIAIDGLAIIINLLRGDFLSAGFSLINIIPLIGSFIGTPIKVIKKIAKMNARINRIKDFVSSDDDDEDENSNEDDYEDDYEDK